MPQRESRHRIVFPRDFNSALASLFITQVELSRESRCACSGRRPHARERSWERAYQRQPRFGADRCQILDRVWIRSTQQPRASEL